MYNPTRTYAHTNCALSRNYYNYLLYELLMVLCAAHEILLFRFLFFRFKLLNDLFCTSGKSQESSIKLFVHI